MLKYLLCVALFLISYLTDAQCYYPYIQNYNPEYCASSDEIKIHSSGYSSGTFTSSGSGAFFPSTGYAPIVVYKLTAEDKIKGFVKISLTVNDGNYYCKLDTATFIMAPILHLDAGPSEISVCSDTVLTATTNTSNRNVFWYWESGYSSGKDHCQFIAVNKELEQGHSILYASVSNSCSQAKDSIKINLKASTFTFVPPLPQCPETTVPLSASGNYSKIKWYSHHGSFANGDSTSVVNFKSFKESSSMTKQYMNVVYSNSKCQSISIVSIDQLLKTESIITIYDTVYCKAVTAISVYGNTYNPKTGYRSHSWTSLGSGIFQDNYGEIQYIPSEQDLIKEKVTLVLTPDADVCSVVSDSINIYFKDVKVNAGKDTTVFCNSFGLKGTVENGSVGFWYAEDNYNTNHNTTRNNNEFSTAFFVSKVDVERGSKKYILEGRKNYSSSCEPVRDTMTVFYKTPVYYASIEPVLCSKEEVELNGSAINATSGVWITTGTGSFTDPFSMNTIYKPSLGDIQSGGVDFILKDPNDCGFEIRKFARLESNVPRVGYFATTGTSFCKGSEINVVYAAGHNMEHNLYSTGTGTLVGDGFSYKYTPTESDFEKGKTEFILSSTAEGYCPGSDTLAIQLINQPGPSLTAGPDQYIKPGNPIQLNGTYSDNGDVYWYSNGSGYFYNSNSLSTTYIPSAEDLRKESLLFTITNYPYSPCGFYKDTMKVVFDRNNTITLGGQGIHGTYIQSPFQRASKALQG